MGGIGSHGGRCSSDVGKRMDKEATVRTGTRVRDCMEAMESSEADRIGFREIGKIIMSDNGIDTEESRQKTMRIQLLNTMAGHTVLLGNTGFLLIALKVNVTGIQVTVTQMLGFIMNSKRMLHLIRVINWFWREQMSFMNVNSPGCNILNYRMVLSKIILQVLA